MVTIPARFVFDAVKELCRQKAKNAIIISAGWLVFSLLYFVITSRASGKAIVPSVAAMTE